MIHRIIASLLTVLALASGAQASEGGAQLDRFPKERVTDLAALQNGAKLFVNYCLNCHSAAFVRYNRLKDIGLTDDQIKQNLLFTAEKVGETMTAAIKPRDAKEWFGAVPPDLTLVARSRASHAGTGPDYLYTSTGTTPGRPAGTTWCSPTWACPTCSGNCRASGPRCSRKRLIRMMKKRRFTPSLDSSS